MLVTNRKAHVNKIKKTSYKKYACASSKQMELEAVIFQYTLDSKQTAQSHSFCSCIQALQNNLSELTRSHLLAKDAKFLRMCALLITELYYKAKHCPLLPRIKKSAKQAIELLTTTFQNSTLLQAAHLFSEQNPQESDLSLLLTQLSLDKMEFLNQFSFKIECLI